MADTKTIEVPVKLKAEFRDINKDLQKVLKNIQDGLTEVDPASGLAKNLTKAYTEFEKQLNKSQGLLNKEFFSEADMSKVTKAWDKISEVLSTIDSYVSRASLGTLGIDIDGLTEAKQKFDDITKARQAFLMQPVKADITAEALSLAQKHAGKSGFKETVNYGRNLANMTTASATLAEQLKVLEKQALDTQEALDKAALSHTAAQTNLSIAEDNKKRQEGLYNTQYSNVTSAFAQAGAAANANSPQSVINAYKNTVASLVSNGAGEFAENGQLIARMIRDWFDLDIDFSKEANEIVEDLQNGLEKALKENSNNWGKRGKLNGKALQNAFTPFSQKAGKDNFSASKTSKELTAAVIEAQEEVDKTKAAIDDTSEGSLNSVKMALDAQITEAKTVINEINAAIEELKQLRNKRGEQAEAIFGDRQRDARQEILDLENQARLNTQYRKNVSEGQRLTHQGTVEADAVVTDRKAAERERKEQEERIKRENDQRIAAEKAAQDSEEQFRQRLTQSIHQWTSVQQIVNKIKDGFRQAIQDIKGLDQAMTNIAVVTDMSVSDLWGKIDEYMSIAQQYGVTTQGVYEVSQLYYQQGLGTDEVMAATTETLKMARIAGMEYAEAADAMTVAIRAFKMEMSDAEHVTDVYSKVAAVTASDTEELAVAMSKTASSAESVGSSFENTTAMLAVMIETTRESAQNLGSALKSIISRYGEMKVGVTVDKDGETIDYNKVDTALKSVGISIKDAQGQFRDFDDVIFELSEKWDSLDKNTQRYIATIMAGNRQQSRFIALVDNWERLDEVAGAAQDSEDAGLLQYAKTLDSLESKVNNIKTSFQQFYMSVFNGPVVGAALEFLNNLIKGFNKLSKLTTIFNAVSIISGIRIIGELVVNTFSGAFKNISTAWKATLKEMRLGASKEMRAAGAEASQAYKQGQQEGNTPSVKGETAPISGRVAGWSAGLAAAGMVASTVGSFIAAKDQTAGAWVSGAGSGLSTAGLALSLTGNPLIAALAGVATAAVSIVTSVPSELEKAQEELAEAKEKAEKSNIERAEKKNEYETLKDGLANLKRLKESRYDSAEAEQEFITANNALLEQFPQLATAFEGAENAIIDLNEAENDLMRARVQASIAAKESADAEIARALKNQAVKKQQASDDETKLENSVKWQANPINKVEGRDGPSLLTANYKHVGSTAKTINWLTGATQGLFTQEELEKWGITALQSTGELTHASNQPASRGMVALQRGEQVVAIKQDEGYALQVLNTSLASASNKIDFTNPKAREWFAQAAQAPNMEQLLKALEVFSSEYLVDKTSAGEQDFIKKLTGGKYSSVSAMTAVTPTAEREVKFAGAALDNAIKAGIADYINSSTMFLGEENSFLTMSNSKRILQRNLEDSFAKYEKENPKVDPEELWKNWTEAADGYSAAYTHWSEQLDAAYKDLKAFSSLEEYNELDKNRGRYTADEYEKALDEFKSLIGEELYTFLTDSVDAAATQAQADFSEAISSINKQDFVNFDIAGFTLPEEYYDEAVDYAKSLNAQVKGGRLHKDTAGQQWENYKKIWAEIDGLTDPNQKLAARQKVSQADLSSITSIRQLEADLAKSGITLGSDIWTSLIKNAAVNLVTEVETLQSSIATQLDASAKAIKNAYNGVDSAAEALKMANKFGVDLTDLDVRNGKFYFEDAQTIRDATQKEWEQTVKDLLGDDSSWWQDEESAFGRAYQDAGDISDYAALEAQQKELLDKQTKNAAAMSQDELDQLALFNQYGDQYKEWASKQSPGTATSFRDFITYVRDTSDAALVTMYEKWQAQIEKEAAKQSTIDSFYGGEAERKKLSAQKSLASGGQGLSGDTIYDILDAYGLSHDDWQTYFTKNADGTFDIITSGKLFNQLDQTTKNAILDKITSDIDSAEQGLQKLGETAATGKKLDASEIRNLLGAEFDGLNDAQATLLYGRLKGYANGKITKNQLIDDIAQRLQDQAKSKGQTLSEEEAKKQAENYFNEIDAQLTDAIKENLSKRLELQAKILQGTATETEKETLKEAGIDISSLESKTNKAIINWINSYIESTDISFDKKVKYTKTAFATALTNEFGEDIGTLGETAVKGVFGTQDAAADFISKYYTVLGQTIDENTADNLVSSWFTRDDSGQYRLKKTIQSLRDELSKIQDSANQEEIDNLEAQLTYYENLQELQRKESLTSSLTSMVSSTTETTASSLMKMVQDAGGAEIKPEDAEKYAEELKGLDPLKRLQKTVSILSKYNVKIDADDYTKLVKSVVSSVMTSAQSAIQSAASGMSWDQAFELQKEIPGLKFEVIDGKLVTTEIEKVAKYYREQLENSISEQRQQLEAVAPQSVVGKATVNSILGLRSKGLTDDEIISSWRETDLIKDALTLLNSDLFNLEDYQSWAANNADGTLNEYWEQYISTLTGEALEAGKKILEDLTKEANKQAEITTRANALKTEAETTMGKTYDRLAAEELIKTQGLTGYDETQIATLEQAGIITEGSAKLDAKTGKYNLTDEHISALNQATQNAVYRSIRNNIRTAAEALNTLGQKMLQGTDTVDDFEAVFGEELSQTDITNLRQDLVNLILGNDDGTAKENIRTAFKKAYPEVTDDTIIDNMVTDYVNKTQQELNTLKRTLYETLLTGLESGSLSIENRATVKAYLGQDVLDEFDEAISENANERAQRILALQGKIIASQLERGDITLTSYYETRASQATQAFNEIYGDNLVNTKHQLASAISGGDATFDGAQIGKLFALVEESLLDNLEEGEDAFTVFGERYIKGLTETGEYLLDVNALRADNIISQDQFSEYQRSIVEKAFSSAEDLMSKAISGDKIDIDELQTTFSELGWNLSDANAQAIIDRGANTILTNIEFALLNQGIAPEDYSDRLKELQTLVMDALMKSITGSLSAFESGMQGTLSETEYQKYAAQYGLSGSARTAKGRQLSRADAQKWLTGEYQRAKANKLDDTFGEDVWKIYSSTAKDGIDGYRDIEAEIQRVKDTQDTNNDAVKEYIELLEKARDAAMLSADSEEFAFMEQDATDGLAKNFNTFTGSIEKVKTAFKTLKSGGKIEFNDFSNIMEFIKNSESAFKTFHKTTGTAKEDYDTLVNTIISKTKDWNQIDIKGIAAGMGISVEAAMSVMKDSMTDGLKEVAQQQINYLSGLEAMLKAMVALEALGAIDLSLSFKNDAGQDVEIQLSNVLETWQSLGATGKQNLELAIKTKFTGPDGIDSSDAGKAFAKSFGFDGNLSTLLFGEDGITGEVDMQMADAFGTLIERTKNLDFDQGQYEALASRMFSALEAENFVVDGKLQAGWQQKFLSIFASMDLSEIPSYIDSQVSAALSGGEGIVIEDGIKIQAGAGGFQVIGLKEGTSLQDFVNQYGEQIKAALEAKGVKVDGIEIEGEFLHFTGDTTDATGTLITQFKSLEDAAKAVQTVIQNLQEAINALAETNAIMQAADYLNGYVSKGTVSNPEDTENAESLNVEIADKNSQEVLDGINKNIEDFKADVEANPITVPVSTSGSLPPTSGQATPNNTSATSPTIIKKSAALPIQQVAQDLPPQTLRIIPEVDKIPEQEDQVVGYKLEQRGSGVKVPSDVKKVPFEWTPQKTFQEMIPTTPLVIPVIYKPSTYGPVQLWTGNVNDISGNAWVEGNVSDPTVLANLSKLTDKTLVGELGPELAVYNHQYHLLGQNGAEFVNLPKNAIVFNHKQTEGIIKGQTNIRGSAMAEGNVSGPALAGGASAALAAVQRAKAMWQGLLNSLTVADLLGGGQGGGGGNTLKGVKEELQEWYNLSRQIANIEQEINNLLAERANIPERDGDAYLRSLRQEQQLLEQQAATQEILLGYQKLQIQRQAEQINTNKIWSQFLEVDENGLLQYTKGNELFGGKGALEVLSDLNKMSGEEQLKFLKDLGYTAKNQDGEELKDQELIQKFYEELQFQIDEYDALYDTIHKTSETLEKLQTKIEEINSEITKNQMDLEKDIFDILVKAWEEEIDVLEEQKDLVEEANDAYVKGLNEALSAEREMYSEEQSIADREQLQRQLSLLRRSGGSASQIADLEQQLDSMLKDEYFRNQEQVIERIEDANEEQIRQLERQIKLQEEALEFEKEHGILWTKVYDIMAGSADQILNFMQGNSPEFFSQSLLQQEKMLTDWAKKIGIYTENKKYEGYEQDIQQSAWDSGDIWSYGAMSGYKSTYDSMTAEQQAAARKMFNTTYANARLAGDDHNTAMAKAQNALINNFKSYKEQQAASGNKPETDLNTGSGSETWYVTGPNKLNLRDQPSKSGNRLAQLPAGTKVKVLKKLDNGWFQVEVDGKTGYVDSQFLSKGTSSSGGSGSSSSSSSNSSSSSGSSGKQYRVDYTVYFVDGQSSSGYGVGGTPEAAKRIAESYAKKKTSPKTNIHPGGASIRNIVYYDAKAYAQGGLVDYTGMAMVHGSKSKPESFLNAKQTAMISEAVKIAGDGGALDGIKTTLNKLEATIKSIVNNNKNETTSFTVAPGAVTIQVAQLNDSYDVEELSKDVMNRMVAIASKSTNRGVNRR